VVACAQPVQTGCGADCGGVGQACSPGFDCTPGGCEDIDECADPQLSGCSADAVCSNSPGSFACACKPGFEGDGKVCADINECADPAKNDCDPNATCANTAGSFTCTCNAPFVGDGKTCNDNGVQAFGEWRPAMKCADFVNNGNNYRQYCFTLKNQTLCIGQTSGANITCQDTASGIRFTFDWGKTWPMRFNNNKADCINYHGSHLDNLAKALGYANFTINQQKSGNSCTRSWINDAGDYQETAGNSGQSLPYDIDFHP
jgi:hypothetical protein